MTFLEIGVIAYTALIGVGYISKLPSLGTVQQEVVYNPDTMKNELNDYDNSLLILLFGSISLVMIIVALIAWMSNEITVYNLQKDAEAGKQSLSSKMCKFFYGRLLSAIIFMINQTEALHQWDLSRLFYEYNDQLNPQESGYLL